ncbi:MAG: type II toxin-antitoxin system ParD family antitoxin [Gammaproteobacteria bacterium]|nr:MAG: type II toxin-antitoxin system ParD family antitoxin [Gammaproteobacteria bacterium]
MKNTSITLSNHFVDFIGEQVNTGRFHSSSEVIRAGLRLLEDDMRQQEQLAALIAVGERQADRGEFVDYSLAMAIDDIENHDV